ncbi:hypothetical protein HPB47_010138, partial [Ixodes persulcatus]
FIFEGASARTWHHELPRSGLSGPGGGDDYPGISNHSATATIRPYRLEHFRDELVRQELFADVVAVGAYQYNHVWAVTFKSQEGKKKILAAGYLTVKDSCCVVIDPCNQDTRLKLDWVLHFVHDDEVRAALAPYGKVMEITRDKLKTGGTANDLPHQLRVAGDLALVVVPGRAPHCLRCRRTGHIRRECRVTRCQCVKTYASVAETVGANDRSEHLMDAADAEEVAEGGANEPPSEATPTLSYFADGDGSSNSKEERSPALKVSPASSANVSQAGDKAGDAPAGTEPEKGWTPQAQSPSNPARTKRRGSRSPVRSVPRSRHQKRLKADWMSFKPKPNILQNRRPLATPPSTALPERRTSRLQGVKAEQPTDEAVQTMSGDGGSAVFTVSTCLR